MPIKKRLLRSSAIGAITISGIALSAAVSSAAHGQAMPAQGAPKPPPPPDRSNMRENYRTELDRKLLKQEQQKVRSIDGREMSLSSSERKAINELQKAVQDKNGVAALAELKTAQRAAASNDAKFAVASLQLQVGLLTSDTTLQSEAIDYLVASGMVPTPQLIALYSNQGTLALNAGNSAKAEAAFAKLVELSPTDPDAFMSLADTKMVLKKPNEAAPLVAKAIELRRAGNQEVPESWTRLSEQLKKTASN